MKVTQQKEAIALQPPMCSSGSNVKLGRYHVSYRLGKCGGMLTLFRWDTVLLQALCHHTWFCGRAQRLCQTNAAAEIQESLEGIRQCCQQLRIEVPVLVAADNCCQIRNAVIKVLPNADVVLDVYHFLMR